jgi:hypothetical protein
VRCSTLKGAEAMFPGARRAAIAGWATGPSHEPNTPSRLTEATVTTPGSPDTTNVDSSSPSGTTWSSSCGANFRTTVCPADESAT